VEKDLGPGMRLARRKAVSVGAPPMSKAERLHRWAASLDLQKPSHSGARNGARHAGDGWRSKPSPLAIAFEEWALQAEGLRSARWGDVRAFFDLSEGEMRHVLGSSNHDSPRLPAAVAAERIRALAERAEATAVPEGGGPAARGWIGPAVRSSRWFPSAAADRRKTEAAGAA
jgi:hypothetical protein